MFGYLERARALASQADADADLAVQSDGLAGPAGCVAAARRLHEARRLELSSYEHGGELPSSSDAVCTVSVDGLSRSEPLEQS